MEKRELIKVMCSAVVLVREGDKILREEKTQEVPCFGLEDMGDFYTKAQDEVMQMNSATNRKTRRAK